MEAAAVVEGPGMDRDVEHAQGKYEQEKEDPLADAAERFAGENGHARGIMPQVQVRKQEGKGRSWD
jgi:hypothetical protein